jgi:hypothetical protein
MMSLKDGKENPVVGSVAWFLEEIYPMKLTPAEKIRELEESFSTTQPETNKAGRTALTRGRSPGAYRCCIARNPDQPS